MVRLGFVRNLGYFGEFLGSLHEGEVLRRYVLGALLGADRQRALVSIRDEAEALELVLKRRMPLEWPFSDVPETLQSTRLFHRISPSHSRHGGHPDWGMIPCGTGRWSAFAAYWDRRSLPASVDPSRAFRRGMSGQSCRRQPCSTLARMPWRAGPLLAWQVL